MRPFFLLIFFTLFLGVHPAGASKNIVDPELTKDEIEERTGFAVELFRKTCFMHFSDRDYLVGMMDAAYKRADGEKTREVLNFLHGADGDVWTASITSKISYTLASETNGNCHVIAQRNSGERLHKEIKNMAMDARDSMSFSVVDYKGIPPGEIGPVKMSKFIVKAPDGSVVVTVSVTTKEDSNTKMAEGVISLIMPQKPLLPRE